MESNIKKELDLLEKIKKIQAAIELRIKNNG